MARNPAIYAEIPAIMDESGESGLNLILVAILVIQPFKENLNHFWLSMLVFDNHKPPIQVILGRFGQLVLSRGCSRLPTSPSAALPLLS